MLWTVGGSVWRRVSLNFGELGPIGQELGVQKASPCLVHSRCTDTQTPSHTAASDPKGLFTLSPSVPAPSGMPVTLPPHCPHSCSGTLPPLPGRVPGHRLSLPGDGGSDHHCRFHPHPPKDIEAQCLHPLMADNAGGPESPSSAPYFITSSPQPPEVEV